MPACVEAKGGDVLRMLTCDIDTPPVSATAMPYVWMFLADQAKSQGLAQRDHLCAVHVDAGVAGAAVVGHSDVRRECGIVVVGQKQRTRCVVCVAQEQDCIAG